jgi:hypothetical protein
VSTPPHPEPGEVPPASRRLERPPSERYHTPPSEPAPAAPHPALALAVAIGFGLAGAALIAALAGLFAVDVGLLVVAVVVGRFVGLALRGSGLGPAQRVALAVAIAVASVAGGAVATWLYARSEGGVLGLVDYLGQAFGPLVPLQALLATIVAWWSAR